MIPHPDRSFSAFLFDMDGTVLSSIAATERVWSSWARRHKLDVETFLPTIHGVRASETIARLNLPDIDPQAEADFLLQAEMDDVEGIVPIEGAIAFLDALPKDRWALVTSAPRDLAKKRLAKAGIPLPPLIVSGEDVKHGKPAPDCFLLAASKLGYRPEECLVFEDAMAGIKGAEAAGMAVAVVTATHSHGAASGHPSFASYESFAIEANGTGLTIIARAPSYAAKGA